jgi:hypothetical protein
MMTTTWAILWIPEAVPPPEVVDELEPREEVELCGEEELPDAEQAAALSASMTPRAMEVIVRRAVMAATSRLLMRGVCGHG